MRYPETRLESLPSVVKHPQASDKLRWGQKDEYNSMKQSCNPVDTLKYKQGQTFPGVYNTTSKNN